MPYNCLMAWAETMAGLGIYCEFRGTSLYVFERDTNFVQVIHLTKGERVR